MKVFALFVALTVASASGSAVELTSSNYEELVVNSGKSAFIKFQAPWCGHCKSMKPAWDQLGSEFEASTSVIIGDADCTVETELCSDQGVSGYPTIKYYTGETGSEGESYSGGRDFDSLKKFTEDTLEVQCDIKEPEGCDEKEQKYITKMSEKDGAALTKELARLEGMKSGKMKAAQKAFLFQRIAILQQMAPGAKEEL